MKIRKRTIIALAAAAILSGISVTYGYFSDIVTVTNRISIGDVNISLKEYERNQGVETSYRNPKIVLPGDVISKIPRIINHGEPCWVRARISYENDRKELEALSDENLIGIPPNWVKQGEYYYYTEILENGEAATLFQEMEIPSAWTEDHSSQKLQVNIQADAIQAANFQPDFDAMSPWGNQEIELCVHEENGKTISERKRVKLSVEFNGSAHKLLAVPEDFFTNIGTAMPGDVFQDSVAVSNSTGKAAEIFFHTGLVCQRADRMDLLKKLQLTIALNGKNIYSGDLQAEKLKEEISLGKILPGEKGTMDFKVSVPKELNNAYALRDTAVKWYFTVYEDEEKTPAASETEGGNGAGFPERKGQARNADSVKTGDESPIFYMLLLGIVSLIALVAVFIAKKGGKKQ